MSLVEPDPETGDPDHCEFCGRPIAVADADPDCPALDDGGCRA